MPKESVYGQQQPAYDPLDPNPKVPVTEVLWNRDGGYVQVVTKANSASGGRWASEIAETHFTDGMYVDLDRAAINKMIRILRRARDQAFGRDE